jgi:hypothetical protein
MSPPMTVSHRWLARLVPCIWSRGIPAELAGGAGVRSADDWYGRPAVVFPIRDQTGRLVAMQGRHTDGRADPKAHDCGPKSTGVFATTGGRPGRIAGSDR